MIKLDAQLYFRKENRHGIMNTDIKVNHIFREGEEEKKSFQTQLISSFFHDDSFCIWLHRRDEESVTDTRGIHISGLVNSRMFKAIIP